MHGFERNPSTERERGLDGDAIERDVQVGARKAVAVHVASDGQQNDMSIGRPSLAAGARWDAVHPVRCDRLVGSKVHRYRHQAMRPPITYQFADSSISFPVRPSDIS
jgi:hypothetical protein